MVDPVEPTLEDVSHVVIHVNKTGLLNCLNKMYKYSSDHVFREAYIIHQERIYYYVQPHNQDYLLLSHKN